MISNLLEESVFCWKSSSTFLLAIKVYWLVSSSFLHLTLKRYGEWQKTSVVVAALLQKHSFIRNSSLFKQQKSLIMVYSFTSIVLEVFETMAHYFVNLCSTNQFLEMLWRGRQQKKKSLSDNNGGFACSFETNDALSWALIALLLTLPYNRWIRSTVLERRL